MKTMYAKYLQTFVLGSIALLVLLTGVAETTPIVEASPMQPFSASGVLTTIDEGDVVPAGSSGRFIVKDRHVLGGLLSGDLVGPLSIEYGTNVPILTQSGQIHGNIYVQTPDGVVKASIAAKSAFGVCDLPVPPGTPTLPPIGLTVEGTFTFTTGTQGHGEFSACVWANINAEGHIVPPLFGVVEMSGQWKQ